MKRAFLSKSRTLFALLLLVLAPASANAQVHVELFLPLPGSDQGIELPNADGEVRDALVVLNRSGLDLALGPTSTGSPQDGDTTTSSFSMRFFPNAAKTFRQRNVEEAVGGGTIWNGESEQNGAATFVTRNGQVTGQVDIDGRLYRIEPYDGAIHRVVELDINALPPEAPAQRPRNLPNTAPHIAAPAEPRGKTTIHLLAGYTAAADAASGDVIADINLAVALANQAYVSSGINMKLVLRGTTKVRNYNEASSDYTATLYNLTNISGGGSTLAGRNAFAGLRAKRDQVGADLVTLVREGGSSCGQAWVIETPSAATSAYGYSQVSRACIPGYTLAHELGHNAGLNHDRFVEPAGANSEFNYGYVNVTKLVRDIMSYSNACTTAGVICTRQNVFSNPQKRIAGARFGVPAGQTGAADATRRLNQTRTGVASYRGAVGS